VGVVVPQLAGGRLHAVHEERRHVVPLSLYSPAAMSEWPHQALGGGLVFRHLGAVELTEFERRLFELLGQWTAPNAIGSAKSGYLSNTPPRATRKR
jgi:hypothetical protein